MKQARLIDGDRQLAGRRVVWFSCGAASAVAAKLTTEKYSDSVVVNCDTLSTEHPDNLRFMRDVERWIGRRIHQIRSEKYASVDDVFLKTRYMAGPKGARCTVEMKKIPRLEFQRNSDVHVFGYSSDERDRADRFETDNPDLDVEWILIDEGVTKAECHRIIANAGIEQAEMYRLGFDHNNCLGCVKATSPGYWNLTRVLFPDVFARRCQQSRALGVRLVRLNNKRIFLDELPPDAPPGLPEDIDCGPVCQHGGDE